MQHLRRKILLDFQILALVLHLPIIIRKITKQTIEIDTWLLLSDGVVTLASLFSHRLCQRVVESTTPPSLQVERFEIYFGKMGEKISSLRPGLISHVPKLAIFKVC